MREKRERKQAKKDARLAEKAQANEPSAADGRDLDPVGEP